MKPLDEPRCGTCGFPRDHDRHRPALRIDAHEFVPPIPPCAHNFALPVEGYFDARSPETGATVFYVTRAACTHGCGTTLTINPTASEKGLSHAHS